ncbi:MAG: PQQ-binding-like beta-propeller repeat protein [Candidatus Thiodiazotropha sp.]
MVTLSVYPNPPEYFERGASDSLFRVEGVLYINGCQVDLSSYDKDYISVYDIHERYALLDHFDLSAKSLICESFVSYPSLEAVSIEAVEKLKPFVFDNSIYPEYLFFSSGKRKERVFHRYNIENDHDLVVPAGGDPLYMDDHMIVVGLVGYDNLGKELWRFNRESPYRFDHYRPKITAVDGLIVFTQGGLNDDQDSVIALNAKTGTKVWEYPLPFEARRISTDNSRVCLATGNQMLVLDPKTGESLAQFEADIEDTHKTMLWYDGDYYYVIDAEGNRIQAYCPDTLHKKVEWQFPEEFRPQTNYPPKRLGETNCMQLLNASLVDTSVYGGLLTWAPKDVQAENPVEFDQPYPAVEVEVFKEGKKEAYRVKVHVQDIHDLLRYGEIEIKRVAANHGKQLWESKTLNKKFNGHVELLVDPAIGEENAQYLDALMRRCEYFARLLDVSSGTGRQPIKATWRFDA